MTTDHAAFLARIIAEPDRDEHRLIYADYLDERGEAARAEFVRVQCELARLGSFHYDDQDRRIFAGIEKLVGDPRYEPSASAITKIHNEETKPKYLKQDALRRRERELFRSSVTGRFLPESFNANITTAEPDCIGGRPGARISRGFVSHVRCAAADWLAHGQEILRRQPVSEVQLTDITRDDQPCKLDIIHRAGFWFLGILRGLLPVTTVRSWYREERFETRAALIEAMPATLRSWGVGRHAGIDPARPRADWTAFHVHGGQR